MAPSRILLMRHAEEPEDRNNPYLSDAGRTRAQQLVPFVTAKYGRPDFAFAAAVDDKSARSYLTIRPLCDAFAVPLDSSFAPDNYRALADRVLADATFAAKVLVICWTHHELPGLASALKAAQGGYPDPWHESVFDLILQFDYSDHALPVITHVVEPF